MTSLRRGRPSLFLVCLLGFLVVACKAERPPEADKPDASSATPTPGAKTWTELPVSKPENRITIHYHRQDENYDGANLFTWDEGKKNTPKNSVLKPVGHDDFGAVFQLDRAKYGESDKIGFITRLGEDWKHKDGIDKFWTPALGNEVWVVSKKNDVLTQRPDISPRVEAAYLDAPDKIVVSLSKPAISSPQVTILDQRGTAHPAEVSRANASPALELTVTPQPPLEVASQHYSIRVDGFGDAVPLTPRGLLDDRDLFYDADAQLGAIYQPQATTFRIFAPTAQAVNVVLYDEASGSSGRAEHALQQAAKGLWETTVDGDLKGKFYVLTLDGPELSLTREVLDPYATNDVSNGTRGRITEITPATSHGPAVASPTDMIIYEMQVRDFTIDPNSGVQNRGLYLGWTEANTRLPGDAQIKTALDNLSELGVTHVQLMPVQDFESDETGRQYNWGYITTDFFSPEGMFATNPADASRVGQLKALIDALHARGIGVIMDVVYNHTAENAPFQFIAPSYYYRHTPDGSLQNGSGCGNDFRTEAPMARKLILDSLKFWVKNYGVDGFRFDLMALIDQETMHEAERELRAINPHIVLYGEPWMGGTSLLRETSDKKALRGLQPIGAFNDDFRNALKGLPEGKDPGWIQNGSKQRELKAAMLVSDWFATPAQSLNYLTCHDNLVLWDKLKISMPGASDQLLEETMKLGYLALFTSQGVPFIHGGEEFARSKGGNPNSYDAPDSVNQVDWELKKKHLALFNYTRALIALRKAHPLFRLRSRDQVSAHVKFQETQEDKALIFTIDGGGVAGETWTSACVALNSSNDKPARVTLPNGYWSIALDGRGEAKTSQVTGIIVVPPKSGLVLYQR